MVKISVSGDLLHLDIEGIDQLWALRSHLEFPLSHVHSVRVDPEAARGWWHGLKLWGSNVPGILTAGTFYQDGIVFYDVHDPEKTIVLELDHEYYNRLIVEVENPERAREMLEGALRSRGKVKRS